MKIGILAWITPKSPDAATVARKCEALGFESFFLPEHPIIPVHCKTPYPIGDGKIPELYTRMVDPFIGLAFAAAATKRIKLGTGVCLVPEHEPITLAKEIATLDLFCGGRFIFGIGAGWLIDESEIMGVDFRRRWAVTREYIRAMKELWTKPEASFEGEFVKFPPVLSYPKPAQKPHPPIHIGAGGLGPVERALKNTVAIADGWAPLRMPPDRLAAELAKLKKMCAEANRISPKWKSPSISRPSMVTRSRSSPSIAKPDAIDWCSMHPTSRRESRKRRWSNWPGSSASAAESNG